MKAKERLLKYGIKAYLKMRGLKKTASRILFYQHKYPAAKLELPSKAPYISRTQKSYWKDVKDLSNERNISIKQTRTLLKKLRTAKNVQVRVIKSGEGWQLVMLGLYEHLTTKEKAEQVGHSFLHYEEDFRECYEEALEECIKEALNSLGGSIFGDSYADIEESEWVLVKVLKETWLRYYGREQ